MVECSKCGAEYSDGATECGKCGGALDGSAAPQTTVSSAAFHIAGRYWLMLLAGALFLVMQWQFPLIDWWKSWNKPYSYYSHGPLVPLIAAFMVWSNRKRMAAIKMRPSWLGLPVILLSIPFFVFGRWTGSGVLCGATFMTFLIGGVLLFTGTRMCRLLLFPILFLISMIPAPATVLDNATLRVQLQSTTVATKMLLLSGYDVTQRGAEIDSGDLPEPLVVGTPCSGFRLLISLLTFTAFFVYMLQTSWWKKTILVIAAFPLSLFINSLRITMIGYAGFWTGSADAMHKFHDWSGYIGLVICFVILFGFAKLIRANTFGIPDPAPGQIADGPSENAGARRSIAGGYRGAVTIALFCLIIILNVAVRPLEATSKGKIEPGEIPKAFGAWTSRDVPIDEMSRKELKTADLLQRVYTNTQDGRQVMLFVEAARDTDAFHDPHSCLPGGGSPITQDQLVDLRLAGPKPLTVKATALQAATDYGQHLVLYWYMSGREACSSTSEVRRTMRVIQLRDLYRLATNPGRRERLRADIGKRQWHWYRFSIDVWQDPDTDLTLLKQFARDLTANSKHFGQ